MSSPFPFIERTKSLVEFIDSNSSACRSVIASLRSLANEKEKNESRPRFGSPSDTGPQERVRC